MAPELRSCVKVEVAVPGQALRPGPGSPSRARLSVPGQAPGPGPAIVSVDVKGTLNSVGWPLHLEPWTTYVFSMYVSSCFTETEYVCKFLFH